MRRQLSGTKSGSAATELLSAFCLKYLLDVVLVQKPLAERWKKRLFELRFKTDLVDGFCHCVCASGWQPALCKRFEFLGTSGFIEGTKDAWHKIVCPKR